MGDGRPPRCSGPAVAGWDPLVSSSSSVSSCTPRSDGMPVRERRTERCSASTGSAHDAAGAVSYWMVREYVASRRPPGPTTRSGTRPEPALKHTMAQSVVQRTDVRIEALRDTIAEMLSFDGPRKLVAGLISGLDVVYDLGEGHPLLGRRIPTSTSSRPPARYGSSRCSMMPGRCCSTSVSPAASTSPRGRTASSTSMPTTAGRGTYPYSEPSPVRPPC